MARPLRIEFEGALYHVTSRGNKKEAIYLDDMDTGIKVSGLAFCFCSSVLNVV